MKTEVQRSGFRSTSEGMCHEEGELVFLWEGRESLEVGRVEDWESPSWRVETLYKAEGNARPAVDIVGNGVELIA